MPGSFFSRSGGRRQCDHQSASQTTLGSLDGVDLLLGFVGVDRDAVGIGLGQANGVQIEGQQAGFGGDPAAGIRKGQLCLY